LSINDLGSKASASAVTGNDAFSKIATLNGGKQNKLTNLLSLVYNNKTKLSLLVNNEGGNISIYPPDSVTTVSKWEMDAYNGDLRVFMTGTDGTNKFPFVVNKDGTVSTNGTLWAYGGCIGLYDGSTLGLNIFCNNGQECIIRDETGTKGMSLISKKYLNLVSDGSISFGKTSWSAGAPLYAASYNQWSSKLIKENIQTMTDEDGMKVLNLNPVHFDYKESFGGKKNNCGLIAEETLEVLPEVVNVPENYDEHNFDESKGLHNDILSIDYPKIVPHLIKLCQMQQKQIDELTKRLKELESKISI